MALPAVTVVEALMTDGAGNNDCRYCDGSDRYEVCDGCGGAVTILVVVTTVTILVVVTTLTAVMFVVIITTATDGKHVTYKLTYELELRCWTELGIHEP